MNCFHIKNLSKLLSYTVFQTHKESLQEWNIAKKTKIQKTADKMMFIAQTLRSEIKFTISKAYGIHTINTCWRYPS